MKRRDWLAEQDAKLRVVQRATHAAFGRQSARRVKRWAKDVERSLAVYVELEKALARMARAAVE